MKIENYTGTVDSFTIPGNIKTVDDSSSSNSTTTTIDYSRNHIHIGGAGLNPKIIAIAGSFFGADKNTDYESLSKHFVYQDHLLKKLYWKTDRFYLGIGQDAKQVNNAGRTNFIDYAASFKVLVQQLFSDTQKTGTLATPQTNSGNITTFIEEITGTITSGAADLVIGDNLGNEITIPNAKLTTGQSFVLQLIKMVDSGSNIFVSEYNYVTLNGTRERSVQISSGFGYLQLESGSATSDITISNLSSYQIKFRDGYSA